MTEEEARAWVRAHVDVPRETKLELFARLLIAASEHQNLISAATVPQIWSRHIVDSAQLVTLATERGASGSWIDIGTGAGLPGLVAAILWDAPVTMIEPRRRRVDFLQHCVDVLALGNARVELGRSEASRLPPASVISARAVAPLPKLFAASVHLSMLDTLWLLPKGASSQSEVEAARKAWQGSFHVEQSITHPDSTIVCATGVKPR